MRRDGDGRGLRRGDERDEKEKKRGAIEGEDKEGSKEIKKRGRGRERRSEERVTREAARTI